VHQVARLTVRNLTISLNPGFIVWQVIFPLMYIFVAGFAYSSLIDYVPAGKQFLNYPAFLATGMIDFSIMNSTLISGVIIWNDRRNGMFEQILSGPFTRTHYIMSNVLTIGIVGLASAGLIILVGLPVFVSYVVLDVLAFPLVIFAVVVGSMLFGSLASIISTRLKSSEGFNVVINTVFLFLAFVSTAFYPAEGVPEPLHTIFYLNPLTYLVDVIRAGIFGDVAGFAMTEMTVIAVLAVALFVIAIRLLTKLDF
jgi:ABC-2 type transport system permease protein